MGSFDASSEVSMVAASITTSPPPPLRTPSVCGGATPPRPLCCRSVCRRQRASWESVRLSLSLSLCSVSSPSLCCCHARSGSCLPCLLAAAVTHTHTRLLLFLPLHLQLNVSSPYCSRGVGEGSLNQTEDRLPSGRGSNCGFIADQGESIRHSCTRGRMI